MDIQTLAIITLLGSFAVMIFLRFPIAYAVGLSSIFCLLVQDKSLMDVCRLMVKGISSFSLMAVPFFITMGVLMGSGGISEKLIALANSCVGWMRGGLAHVNVVASFFFGGISGSASADTASIYILNSDFRSQGLIPYRTVTMMRTCSNAITYDHHLLACPRSGRSLCSCLEYP